MIVGERKRKKKTSDAKLPEPVKDDWSRRYEIERDLEALCRADAVKADTNRMALCKKMAKEKLAESQKKKAEAQAMIEMAAEE